ncbi:MAG: EamA family transporter [Candidatus Doudnabacteria bacterium]|nr:EamA family transporter [Candidatus Doudnabacteria bacterium]
MITLLTIFQYLIQAVVDLMDKFLITARKLEPVKYTFYTVATGALLAVLWPWNFAVIPLKFIVLDLFSGAFFSLAMYVFFVALSQGEVSRVVPFVFGLVPVFDVVISLITGHNSLRINELAAVCLLIPGALLISHQKHAGWIKHAGLKVLSALLFSVYYALWQFGAQSGPVLNNLIWNRLGAAAILVLLLLVPVFRKKVFSIDEVKNRANTSFLFLFKQVLGGANFIFLSFLFVVGKISIINALQGFRYAFLLLLSFLLARHHMHLMDEKTDRKVVIQKTAGIILIFIGTVLLFVT